MLEMFRYLKMFIIVYARGKIVQTELRKVEQPFSHWASSSFTFHKKAAFFLYTLAMNGWVDSAERDLIWKGELVQPSSFNLDFYVGQTFHPHSDEFRSNSTMDLICESSKLPIILRSRDVYEFLIEGGIKRRAGSANERNGMGSLITYFSPTRANNNDDEERKQKENWKSNKLRYSLQAKW